jgi:SAM-dependent methyltransferase
MMERSGDPNLQIYNAPQVAAHYAALDYLTPCERLLFQTYIPAESDVLDLGVGGGRTTAYLAQRAKKYVGVDYAPAMIEACRARFPEIEFAVGDASDLSAFPENSFDAVVFAFNGIDYLIPDQARKKCLEHILRILRPGAVVIFSSHNPRAVLIRVRGNGERLRALARQFSAGSELLCAALAWLLISVRGAVSFGQSGWATLKRAFRRLPTRAFWRGEGILIDPSHGGLLTHYWIPDRVVAELTGLNFGLVRILGDDLLNDDLLDDDHAERSHPYATDWYYYVFAKTLSK